MNAAVTPFSQEIKTTDNSFKVNACWSADTPYPIGFDVGFHTIIKVDGQLGRATFADKSNHFEINGTISTQEQCVEMTVFVVYSAPDIFKPVDIEMTYSVLNAIPQTGSGKSR